MKKTALEAYRKAKSEMGNDKYTKYNHFTQNQLIAILEARDMEIDNLKRDLKEIRRIIASCGWR